MPVAISCGTEGAVIHYTTDGSEPTNASPAYTVPLSLAQTTTFKAKAFVDNVGASATATATLTCVTDAGLATAYLVGVDAATLGTWKGNYGTDGWWIAQDPSANANALPSYATVSVTGQTNCLYSSSSTDLRALQKAANLATDRLAAGWQTTNNMTFDVNLTDNAAHLVVLYFLGWSGSDDMNVKTEIFDAVTDTLLESQNLDCASTGKYFGFYIKGHVKIKITNLSGNGCASVAGLFFDPADSDDDGLSDANELHLWNTDPLNSDTDGDGVSDYLEATVFFSDPTVADIEDTAVTIATLAGNTATIVNGEWECDDGVIYARSRQGSLDYTVTLPASGFYAVEVDGAQNDYSSYETSFTIDLAVDGAATHTKTLTAAPVGSVGTVCFYALPKLAAGSHVPAPLLAQHYRR